MRRRSGRAGTGGASSSPAPQHRAPPLAAVTLWPGRAGPWWCWPPRSWRPMTSRYCWWAAWRCFCAASRSVGDVDVVIEPSRENLRRLRAALAGVALRPRDVPAPHRLAVLPVVTIATSYGRVDCLLEPGRRDWARLRQAAGPVMVADVSVLVASADDAWALRRRFKGSDG